MSVLDACALESDPEGVALLRDVLSPASPTLGEASPEFVPAPPRPPSFGRASLGFCASTVGLTVLMAVAFLGGL